MSKITIKFKKMKVVFKENYIQKWKGYALTF